MRPSSAETSEPACTKRKMLSMNSSTSWPWSRKYSAIVRPDSATRIRAPGGSFICPNTSIVLSSTPDSFISSHRSLPSRERSPTPQKAHSPPCFLARLWMSSFSPPPPPPHRPGLPALGVRREQVDDLDARLEHLRGRRQVLDARRLLVDAAALDVLGQGLAEVDRLAEQVEDAPERRLAHRHRDRGACVEHLRPAREPIGRVHRDRTHAIVAEMLLHLAHEQILLRASADPRRLLLAVARRAHDRDRVVDLGQAVGEHSLDHDALDLLDAPDVARGAACGW